MDSFQQGGGVISELSGVIRNTLIHAFAALVVAWATTRFIAKDEFSTGLCIGCCAGLFLNDVYRDMQAYRKERT